MDFFSWKHDFILFFFFGKHDFILANCQVCLSFPPISKNFLRIIRTWILIKIAYLDIAPQLKIISLILMKTDVRFIIPVLQVKKKNGAQRSYVTFPAHATNKWQNRIPNRSVWLHVSILIHILLIRIISLQSSLQFTNYFYRYHLIQS